MKHFTQLVIGGLMSVVLGSLAMGPAYAQSSTYGSYGTYSPGGDSRPPDSDRDGLDDVTDLCPTEPGPATTSGCPVEGLTGFSNCIHQGYATASWSDRLACAAGIVAAGMVAGAIFACTTPIAVSGALAAWAPLAQIVGGASFGALCACFIAWFG